MSNNKQTAVDYIDKAIDKYLAYSVEGSHKAEPFTITDLRIAVEQAKEMEKHQQDTFAIDFAEWYEEDVLAKEEDVLAKGDYEMIAKDKKKLLEIFKETYGKQK